MPDITLAVALFFGLVVVAVAVVVAAHEIGKAVAKTIDIKHDITVQAPTALIPEYITALLLRIEEKLDPPLAPLNQQLVADLVEQGVDLAERTKGLKGPDKFRIAREYVIKQIAEMKMTELDSRALALRIEASVAQRQAESRTQQVASISRK